MLYYYYYYYYYYYTADVTLVEKGNVHPITYREGTEGDTGIAVLFLTLALEGVGGQRHVSAALPRGKTRYPFYRRLGGPQDRSARARKISPSTGIRSQDRTHRSESYRLSLQVNKVFGFIIKGGGKVINI